MRSIPHYKDAGVQTVPKPIDPLQSPSSPPKDGIDRKSGISQTVDTGEHERVKAELSVTSQELQRVINARDALETKWRLYRKTLDQWHTYRKEWIDKKGPRRNDGDVRSEREGVLIGENGHNRASSASACLPSEKRSLLDPSQFENLAQQSPIELSTTSNVPPQAAKIVVDTHVHSGNQAVVQESGSASSSWNAVVEDPTQASDADDDAAGFARGQMPELRDAESVGREHDDESDSPVVISVRPLKRKRGRNDSSIGPFHKFRRENDAPGTASKPVHVKSDPLSSSPLAAMRLQNLEDAHDSMDLDEVGSKTTTPRKHQCYRLVQERSPTAKIPSLPEASLPCFNPEGRNDMLDDSSHSDDHSHEVNRSQSSILDEASCRRRGEEYAARLWRYEQARQQKRHSSQVEEHPASGKSLEDEQSSQKAQKEPDQQVGELAFATTADRQVNDFNQRLREAECGKPAHAATPKTPKPVDPSMSNSDWNNRTATRDFGLPTPATNARPHPCTHLDQPRKPQILKYGITHTVLQPTDPNNQILPRTSELLASEKQHCPPSRRDRGAAQIHTVLEDGEETRPGRKEKRRSSKPSEQPADENGNGSPISGFSETHSRLGTLLARPSPGRPTLPAEKLNAPRRTDQRKSRTPPPYLRPGVPLPNTDSAVGSPQTISASKAKKPSTYSNKLTPASLTAFDPGSNDPPPVLPDDEPLRSRPVHRLRREDFKLNPAANQGFTHAYREVIRKREARKCLPNCNRPDCCGDAIKKFLAIGGPLPRHNRGLFEPSPPDDESGGERYDYNVLREYMGDNYRNWSGLSDGEKRAEWDRAQAWDWGRRYGKHKSTGRQLTPPGYWNVDFENTQEAQKHREEEEKIAREEVAEKWREAMRKGGLWKFADE